MLKQKFKVYYKTGENKIGWTLLEMSYTNLMFGLSITQKNKGHQVNGMSELSSVYTYGFDNVDIWLLNEEAECYEPYLENVSKF